MIKKKKKIKKVWKCNVLNNHITQNYFLSLQKMVSMGHCQQILAFIGILVFSTICTEATIAGNTAICSSCNIDSAGCFQENPAYLNCLNDRRKRESGFWKRDAGFWKRDAYDEGEELDDDTDKRARYFLGKRPSKFFLGKRDWDQYDSLVDEDLKRGRIRQPFLGKRGYRQPFLGKRARYFLGKREDDFEPEIDDDDLLDQYMDKRARYFLGKRAKYFLGKRESSSNLDDLLKRAKYFLGKRSVEEDKVDEKRQKYFLGKRSAEDAEESN